MPETSNQKRPLKATSLVRYILEQYFGISHLHNGPKRARFSEDLKSKYDLGFPILVSTDVFMKVS
jgi:hypothetical protein